MNALTTTSPGSSALAQSTAASSAASAPGAGSQIAADEADNWGELLLVKSVIAADLAIANLTVGDLFRLDKGSILVTSHLSGTNVPLLIGGRILAWGEFQVNGDTLGVRVAEMA
jgi:flagellar motor switch/type III secretory pathway protein FliN